MTRQNKLIALILYLIVLIVSMLVYRHDRAKKVKLLRSNLAKISVEQEKVRAVEAEATRITHLIPADAGITAFIELLYRAAHDSGLNQHEVTTELKNNPGTARPAGPETNHSVIKHRLTITANGSYRNFAEYLRRVQNIDRLNRILDFKLVPGTVQLAGTMTIELYSLPVK